MEAIGVARIVAVKPRMRFEATSRGRYAHHDLALKPVRCVPLLKDSRLLETCRPHDVQDSPNSGPGSGRKSRRRNHRHLLYAGGAESASDVDERDNGPHGRDKSCWSQQTSDTPKSSYS